MGKMTLKKKLLGYCGVDSGQLLITDPCYIGSEWKEKEFQDLRLYRHNKSGRLFSFGKIPKKHLPKGATAPIVFEHYDQAIYRKKSLNMMTALGEVTELTLKAKEVLKGDYSYAGCCETSVNGAHQLNYALGHAGAGVVFRSGYGDGSYPVYGFFNAEGRCMKVEVDMR